MSLNLYTEYKTYIFTSLWRIPTYLYNDKENVHYLVILILLLNKISIKM